MLHRRGYILDYVVVKRHETDTVPLPIGEKCEACRQVPRIIELRDFVAPVAHRCRDVEQDTEIGVCIRFEKLDIVAV